MSKSDNVKRAKLLCKQKKAREKQVSLRDQLERDKQFLRDMATKDNVRVVDRDLQGGKEKISTKVLEMIKPILFTALDEEDARGIVSMGVIAWNCGIIKQTLGEEKLQEALEEFKTKEFSSERKLLDEYIKKKCNQYGKYKDFILDFRLSFERDGKMNFSVITDIFEDKV